MWHKSYRNGLGISGALDREFRSIYLLVLAFSFHLGRLGYHGRELSIESYGYSLSLADA